MKLVIYTQVGVINQTVTAIADDGTQEQFSTPFVTLADAIVKYCNQHQGVTEIVFYGSKPINNKFKQDLLEKNITQYCSKDLKIYLKQRRK